MASGEPMSFGEPAPKPNDLPSMHDLVMQDMAARKQFGLHKYGTILQPFNGRDALKDAYEEILDLAVYLRQKLYEQEQEVAVVRELTEQAEQVNCYCGGPEEIYPHAYGTRRHCREAVKRGTQAPPC